MKTMAQVIASCGLALLACLAQPHASLAQPAAPVTLKIGISYPGVEDMPLYVAQREGYLRDEHLAVELIALSSGDKIAFALLGQSIELAVYTPDWFIRAMDKSDAKLKVVLGSTNDLIFNLIVAKEIGSYADLKGKRIGVSTIKAADAYLVRKMMAAHGMAESDYILIQAGSSPDRAAALKAGSLSGTLLTPPSDQRILDEGGFERLDLSSSVLSHYAWQSSTVREDWARANKPVLVGYIRAWIKGSRWLRDPKNEAATLEIMARELRLPEIYARSLYDRYYGPQALGVTPDGVLDVAGYQALLKDLADQGQIAAPPSPPDRYVDTSYWEEARRTIP
jgi:ABC-type nitrate/sulfonate/bicarbonate transport system substrate-binding protein